MGPCVSKVMLVMQASDEYSSYTNSINKSWKLVRNACSWVPPQIHWTRGLLVGPCHLGLNGCLPLLPQVWERCSNHVSSVAQKWAWASEVNCWQGGWHTWVMVLSQSVRSLSLHTPSRHSGWLVRASEALQHLGFWIKFTALQIDNMCSGFSSAAPGRCLIHGCMNVTSALTLIFIWGTDWSEVPSLKSVPTVFQLRTNGCSGVVSPPERALSGRESEMAFRSGCLTSGVYCLFCVSCRLFCISI